MRNFTLFKLPLLTALACFMLSAVTNAQTVVKTVSEDVYVSEAEPDVNFGDAGADMHIINDADHNASKEILLKFDISGAREGVGAATLQLKGDQKDSNPEYHNMDFWVSVYGSDDNTWSEGDGTTGVTWNTKPETSTGTLAEYNVLVSDDHMITSDELTVYINSAIAKGMESVTFVVKGKNPTPGNRAWFSSKDWKPGKLHLDYSIDPPLQALMVSEDVYVSQGEPDVNFGDAGADMHVINDADNSLSKEILLKFDISGATRPAGAVTLEVRGDQKDTNPDYHEVDFWIEVYGSGDNSWSEGDGTTGVTWNTKPAETTGALAEYNITTSDFHKVVGEHLTNFVNEAIARGEDNVTFVIKGKSQTPGSRAWLSSKDWKPAMLHLDFSIVPPNQEVNVLEDVYVSQGEPDVNYGNAGADMHVINDDDNSLSKDILLKFDISGVSQPAGAVTLEVRGDQKDSNPDYHEIDFWIDLYGSDDNSWMEGDGTTGVTWNTKPETSTDLLADYNITTSDFHKLTSTELTNYVNSLVAMGQEHVTFVIKGKNQTPGSRAWLSSKDWKPAKLLFDYSVDPPEQSLTVQEDVYVSQGEPDVNFGDAGADMHVINDDANSLSKEILLKFDISASAGFASNAILEVRGDQKDANPDYHEIDFVIGVYGSDDNTWSEGDGTTGVTWNTKPETSTDLLAEYNIVESAFHMIAGSALTEYVNKMIANGSQHITFVVKGMNETPGSRAWLSSKDWKPAKLHLEHKFTARPEQDTSMVLEDVYVSQGEPDVNFGDAGADMHVINDDDNNLSKHIYLKYDISEVEPGIGAATLFLRGDQKDTNPDYHEIDFKISVFGCDTNSWSEGDGTTGLTWNTKPEASTGALAEANIVESKFHELTSQAFTDYINQAIENDSTEITLIVKGKNQTPGSRAWFSSKDWKPSYIVYDYSTQSKSVIEDTYVDEADPDANFEGVTALKIAKDTDGAASSEVYLKFGLSGATANVLTSKLLLKGNQDSKNPDVLDEFIVQVFGCADNSWEEGDGTTGLTWNNKPASGEDVLVEYNITESAVHELSSSALTDYINEQIIKGNEYISFVIKAKDENPGYTAWISSKEWVAPEMYLDYRALVVDPVFSMDPGEYYGDSIVVDITTETTDAMIYYTLDGSDPSDASTLLGEDGIVIKNDTVTIKAIGYKEGMTESGIVEAEYAVIPAGNIQFDPAPGATYVDNVTVTISAQPENATILYSDDPAVAPSIPYPEDGIFLEQTTTLSVVALSGDLTYQSPVVEGVFNVIVPVAGVGQGPGGVGYKDATIKGQPENLIWLAADAISGLADGDSVTVWEDQSGNGFNATNDLAGEEPSNYHKAVEGAPTYWSDGLNGKPWLNFGEEVDGTADARALSIPDNERFDNTYGLSIFMVLQRNNIPGPDAGDGAFRAIIEKRHFFQEENNAWIIEFSGGNDVNVPQLVMNKAKFVLAATAFQAEVPYIINADYDGLADAANVNMRVNGVVERSSNYSDIIQPTDCPLVIGNADLANFSEVIVYRSSLNTAQQVIVHNYLAAKYGLMLDENELYTNTDYIEQLIGIGAAADGSEHFSASGGNLILKASPGSMGDDSYILAAHDGTAIEETETAWTRHWYVEAVGDPISATMAFNFVGAGLGLPSGADAYGLYYKASEGDDWMVMDVDASIDDDDNVAFQVSDVQSGYYTVGMKEVGISNTLFSGMVNVYPNPVNENLNLVIDNEVNGDVDVRIMDYTGKVVHSQKFDKVQSSFNRTINVNKLANGFYMIEVRQNGAKTIRRFTKR